MPSVRLFVYGSLKRAGRHHEQLVGARFLGLAETAPGYRLEQLGEYLALAPTAPHETAPTAPHAPGERSEPNGTDHTVTGELFEVDESHLPALDAFEGDAYCRVQVQVQVRVLVEPSPAPGSGATPGPDRAQTRHEFAGSVFALAYLKKAG